MKTVTVSEIQKLDALAISQYGIPSIVLMENAGRLTAQEVLKVLRRKKAQNVVIVCGLGNNAGDGFVVARHLIEEGVRTKVYLLGSVRKLKQDALVNYQILKKLKYRVQELKTIRSAFVRDIKNTDVVVDAVFGVGLNRDIKGLFKEAIENICDYAKCVVSVDVPSGLNGTTGKIHGVCVKAKKTVTFSFAKKGFLIGEGPKYVGQVIVKDIGIPMKLKKCV